MKNMSKMRKKYHMQYAKLSLISENKKIKAIETIEIS